MVLMCSLQDCAADADLPPPPAPGHLLADTEAGSLLELAPDGIFVADVEGRYVYVNAAGARMLGRERDEILGCSIMDFIHPRDLPRLMRERESMLTGRPHVSEWQLRRKDGGWVDVEVTANIVAGGRWQGFVRDISERKVQQADRRALFEEAERDRAWLHAVIDRLPMGVVLFQHDGRMAFNQRAEELLGMSLSTDGGPEQYADRLFHPDGRPVPVAEFPTRLALSRGKTVGPVDHVIRRADGSEVPILGSAAPILDSQGNIRGAVGVFQDLSESMRLQRAVRENERLLDAVFELLPSGVCITDAGGRVIRGNRAGTDLWRGGPDGPAQGVRKGWWVDSGEPIATHEWPGARALARGETSKSMVRIECFDGSHRTLMKYASPLRDEHGRITGAVVVDEDITALYETQQKLQAGERLFRTVIDLLPVGVYIADQDGRITLGNPAGQRIWQGIRHVGPEDFGDYKAWWVDTGQPLAADDWAVTRAVRHGQTSRGELIRIQCFDGSFKTIINWAAPIRSEDGRITGAVALNEDVTGLYETQEQLRAAVRDREQILAVVAHDLRNPLSALALRAATAESQARALAGAGPLRATTASMREIARGMSGLVDDLLAISVARSGHSMLKLAPVAPATVLARAAESAEPLYAAAGLQLVVEASSELPTVQMDFNRIRRVFANLLDNALKFSEPGGRVLMRAEPAPGGVLFSVANSGAPLQPQEMERLFQPFWQAGREDRRGAGLGLSICRSIIEAHGGSVWAEPAVGMRVKIQFLLPLAIPAAEA